MEQSKLMLKGILYKSKFPEEDLMKALNIVQRKIAYDRKKFLKLSLEDISYNLKYKKMDKNLREEANKLWPEYSAYINQAYEDNRPFREAARNFEKNIKNILNERVSFREFLDGKYI